MSFMGSLFSCVLAAILLIAANGCSPADSSQEDEEKEPHFVLGNSRFNGFEYDGAIEAFQESLEINPHSAQAHYRLAQLYDTKRPDPAAAIYHYQEYLRLDPAADNADVIRQRIVACKQQLAADVMALPTTPRAIRQIEELTETNRLLQAQVDHLNDAVQKWSVYAASLAAAKNNPAPQTYNDAAPVPASSLTPDDTSTGPATPSSAVTPAWTPGPAAVPVPAHPARAHVHVVLYGETLASIARKHGVSLTALEAANPGVSPKHMRAGQTLNLP